MKIQHIIKNLKLTTQKVQSLFLFLFVFLSLFISVSFAQDFTAKSIGDYGNVTVMEITGNYDAKNPDGTINSIPRQAIAKEFFRTHKDEYDFIVIFSNFDFQLPPDAKAFYHGVKNDIQGIGIPLADNSSLYGSNSKLQGTIDMGNIATIVTNPLDSKFEETLSILAHEQMHRWGAYVKFKDTNGNISTALLGKDLDHWSYLLNSYGSVLYGNYWQDNGNGTFISIATQKYYSPLDLYLMGFYDKSQVLPMLLIENPDIDPAKMPETGATITGTPRYIAIDDIIAAEGERTPGPSESQKTFRTAFILITASGTFNGYELYGIENIRNGWVTRFSVLTDGKGIMQVAPTPIEEIPSYPGIPLPPYTPRSLPPDIEDGVMWLMNNQGADGGWFDLNQTTARDTAEAVFVLKNFAIAEQNYSAGLQWLNFNDSENVDYLSRKIETLVKSGQDIQSLIDVLISRQNKDGGWGSNEAYASNLMDTSFVLKSLSFASYSDLNVISEAIEYLKSKQNTDGGWGGDDEWSAIEATANVLTAFSKYRNNYQIEEQITKGVEWLKQRQDADGGFGNSPTTVYDTALSVLTLREFSVSSDITNNGLNYILTHQSEDGSWHESPYQTALAVNAVWKATIDPDLSIKIEDITFIPPIIKTLPTTVVMNVNIWNLGRMEVPQAKVVLYEEVIAEATKIGELVLAFPGQSSVTATFSVTIRDGNEHRFYISVDPDNLIKESNEGNNVALNILKPEGTYDFEILPSDISVSQNPVDIFQDVKISSKITNKGTMNAYNVQLKYYIDEAGTPFDIATATVNIPANTTISNEITWRTNKVGENLPVTVFIDAFNTFAELSEDNNKAIAYLTVNGSTQPNLTTSYEDMIITPNPAKERGNATISTVIKNEGFSTASDIKVYFYKGTPGVDGVLLGSQTISSLDAGESSAVSIDWINIMESGEKIIYFKVDPDNLIKEISKGDNDAFTTLKILSLPDLTVSTNSIIFNPPAPKDGDTVSIAVSVQNRGEQEALDVSVAAYEGSTIIGSQPISLIQGNSQGSISFIYDTVGKSGTHKITVKVDPDNAITEQSEDNNSAFRTFGVQDANLWLTEQYISPNGDGVKDSTQFFFGLSAPQTIKVIVVNGKGETVRTFSGSEFENTSNGNITWDGLDDNGMVVDDGQYQIKIVDVNNNVPGSLLVVVDNNRSPLTDAIGTKYLLNNNLTCMLPDIDDDWKWFPDESGILFEIPYQDPNTPEYLDGLYTMSPNGEDILRITPNLWSSGDEPTYSGDYTLSPDGEKVAFIANKLYIGWTNYVELSQLLVMDRDGKSMTLYDDTSDLGEYWIIHDIVWSPDGNYIAYGHGADFMLINANGTGKIKIDGVGDTVWKEFIKWSPDNRKVAYAYGYGPNMVRVYDLEGSAKNVFAASEDRISYQGLEWLDNGHLVVAEELWGGLKKLWLVDAAGNGDNKELIGDYDFDDEFSIAPDKKSFAFITSRDKTRYLNIADVNGNPYVLHELETTAPLCVPDLYNIIWSPDSSKIAFLEAITTCGDCPSPCSEAFEPHIVAIDLKTKTKSVLSFVLLDLVQWLSDNLSIVGQRYDKNYRKEICVVNIEKDNTVTIASDLDLPYPEDKLVSPLERYIAFYKNVEQSSVCYGRGYQDLWTISSLLNLTADLRIIKEKSAIILKGVAADLHFEGYMLEYADSNNPNTWNLIAPPSNAPVINDVFTTWVPSYEGIFYVRLTVWDKAGNVAINRKRVSWGLSSSIANLYKSHEIFSPNGDGVKDSVELHYRVLEPVHLEFTIYDANNSVIRTINRDYTSPADDYITWDGRDSSGKIVPDGKYKIKVFDYEFFFEVDNTPPDIGISLKGLMQDFDVLTGMGSLMIYTELEGHAIDNNLKNWIVEYGEGDNPQEWYEYISGKDQLVGRDEDGNPVLEPIKDDTIETYFEDDIEWLIGKKLKITAEDFAGNKSTSVTDFLEEKIILHKHQWNDHFEFFLLSMPQAIYPDLAIPRLHLLGGLETIRVPIVSMNVQYHSNGQWLDSTPVMNPTSGIINLEWDNSSALQEINAVRINAIDILGHEHYSNEVLTTSLFFINLCSLTAGNYLLEDLKLLKLQVRSDQDMQYAQWTNLFVDDSTAIPVGTFSIRGAIPDLQPSFKYKFRMVGIGVSGKYYESNAEYPPVDCTEKKFIKISLLVNYKEADCGLISDGKALLSAKIEGFGDVSLRTISYYIQQSGGFQLLQQFDIPTEGFRSAAIDTLNMPEGSYPAKAVLSYLDLNDNRIKELTATNTLIVDRVLPTAQITYPADALLLCPIKISDIKGDWYGISIEGIAIDNTNVKRYELYYGIGENPKQWMPAMTRKYDYIKKAVVDEQIIGYRSKQGKLGVWNLTDIKGTTFSLKLKAIDTVGNVSCYTTNFSVDDLMEISDISTDKSLFSPNGDGVLDDMTINYKIDEYAAVDVKVFKLLQKDDGSYVLDSTPVRTIVSGLQHLGGTENTTWDGKDDSNNIVSDGYYGIAVYATDSCSNTIMDWIDIEIDNTPPDTIITYPGPLDPVGNIVEVKGTADDTNFQYYTLEAGRGNNPDEWVIISSNNYPVKENILGTWNASGLNGTWTLRLTAIDIIENKNATTVTIDLGLRKNLVNDLNVIPKLFSPNNDGKLDTTSINYNLTDACQVQIDILDSFSAVKKTFTTTTPSAGTYSFIWDGKDNSNVTVIDGAYIVKLSVALSSNLSVTQEETVTIAVDATPPMMDIKQPLNNSYIKDDLVIHGSIIDQNLLEYSISYSGDAGNALVDKTNQNRENYTFDVLNALPEWNYTLNVKAGDLGENTTETNIAFTIDRTPPQVVLTIPKEGGEYYGASKTIINITGSITEMNLETYSLRYGSGNNPSQWTVLQSGNVIPVTPELYLWNVGKGSSISDGVYTLSLYAKDKASSEGEARVKITIDNTLPEALITSPQDGGYLRAPIDIKGTASDSNFDKYTLELSEGQCNTAFKWAALKTSSASVRDSILATLQTPPSDGDYCIRLTAYDKLENKSEAKVNIKVDTHPPAPPVLSGGIENKTNVNLGWAHNFEPDLSGYDIYKNGQKINTTLIKETTRTDQSLTEGSYTYSAKAVDLAGNESTSSNEIKLRIDTTGPDAKIRSPQDGSMVSGLVDIKGTAYSSDDFKQYRIYIAQGQNPVTWNLIRTSPVPVSYGTLTQWDTIGIRGLYSIKLEAEDLSGNINAHQVAVTIDDIPPTPPVLVSAIPDGSEVTLAWLANTESDLAGYLVYRNFQLANVSGIVIGDLKPYLISATTYSDKNLPDGKFKYYLLAMDKAGNLSDESNVLEVTIDTRPPHATIVEPADKSKFQNKTLIKAETPDSDIDSIQFQYKRVEDTTWINLGNPVTQTPYITYLDPSTLGLTYGDYNLRALATDKGGKTDPAPLFITITYTDLTAPDLPKGLKALTNGQDVKLTWTANTEADLNGYNIYRTSGGTKTKINISLVKETTYQDKGLSDGLYSYEITAVDTYGNESKPSNSASAKVYAPKITQPYTPTDKKIIQINGSNAEENSVVDIYVDAGSGPILHGTTNSDAQRNFIFNLTLASGENKITAKATDGEGHISRISDMVVVVFNEPPSAPTGLTTSINNYDVNLLWNPNTESDLSGYNLYRNEEKVNAPVAITSGNITASSSDYYNPPAKAFDSSTSTSWMSYYSYGAFNPEWWEIGLPSPELINHIEVHWESELYAGKNYEIQVWSGYAWITQAKVTSNTAKENTFNFKPSYRTDKIRVYITETTSSDYSKQVRISEIKILKDNLITQPSSSDLNLDDKEYSYKVTAVDYYGFESLPSAEVKVIVGDVSPPAPPQNLTATALGSDAILNWAPNTEADLAGYNVYRNTTQGWLKINASLITETTFADVNLPNGTYTYRVTAVDTAGNESLPSNEALAVLYVTDTIPPSKPLIFFPTISGIPVVFYKDKTDISGSAEPASTSEIFRNGISTGKTYAYDKDTMQSFTIASGISEVSISPDGKTLSYVNNDSLWLKTLSTGNTSQITQKGYSPAWSSDGSKLAYIFPDSSWNYHIGIYDLEAGKALPLTDDVNMNEDYPSWSFDGEKIAFVSNRDGSDDVWVKDLISGSLTKATNSGYPSNPKLSPDGKKLAYFENQNLYIVDLFSGNAFMVDDNTDWYSLDWSQDSKRLLFISYANGNGDIFVYDLDNTAKTQITEANIGVDYPRWSPDGDSIVFVRYEDDGSLSVWIISSDAQNQRKLLQQNMYNLNYLSWARSGGIAYSDQQDELNVFYPKGYFSFKDVQLDAGENIFYATSADASGNVSSTSEEISVIFDSGLFPDLETTTDDIFVYPPYTTVGGQVLIDIVVWNKGQVEIRDVDVDIYLMDSTGNIEMLKSEKIPYISSDAGEIIGFVWDSKGKSGVNTVIAVIDPENKIQELNEGNNFAIKELVVVSSEGILMTATLDSDKFQVNQDVNIHINLKNSGLEKDVTVSALIEDENKNVAATLSPINTHIPYASQQDFDLVWNTGITYAGSYRAHTVLKDGANVITEGNVPFAILPDINIDSSVVTNKIAYGPNEYVFMTITIKNNGNNYVIPGLEVKVKVMDASNNILFNDTKNIVNLFPGASNNINSTWNIGILSAGNYTSVVEIYRNDELILSKAVSFMINSSSIIAGSISVSPTVVLAGGSVQVGYVAQNTGNAAMNGLALNLLIIDPETQTIMSAHEDMIDLGMNTTKSGVFTFSTQGYGLKTYTASLQYVYQGNTKTLATAAFTVRDGSPPVINIISPRSGNCYSSKLDIAVLAIDSASGVARVECQIDNGAWKPLPISDPSTGKYLTIWTPLQNDEGIHSISFRATDKAGNKSLAVSIGVTIDQTPPVIIISPSSDVTSNVPITMTYSVTDNLDPEPSVEANYSTLTLFDKDGIYTVTVKAQDSAGNKAEKSSAITIEGLTNLHPVANAGQDQNVITGMPVILNGSESYDPEGALITFHWTFIEVPVGSNITDTSLSDVTSAKPTFTPAVDGAYELELIVNDGVYNSDSDEVLIIASTPNVAPNANAGPDQNVIAGREVYLDGSGSNDPDNGPLPLTYLWSFDLIPTGSSLTDDNIIDRDQTVARFLPDVDGSYVLRLAVSDSDLMSYDDTLVIATTPNVPPNAIAGADITIYIGETAVLDGSTSNDPDDGPQPLSYRWKFVAVPKGSQLNNDDIAGADTVSSYFIPDVAGTYVLQLMVSDELDFAFDNVAVTVIKRAATLCSILGNDPAPSILDQDIFKFNGTKGETIKIQLDANPPEVSSGKRVTLLLLDNIPRVLLFKMDRTVLPNEITATLPATGEYLITVAEQPKIALGERYRGPYCLTLEALPETYQTFSPAFWVE